MQTDLKEGPVREMKPTREGMKKLPKAIAFPQFPSVTAYDDDGVEEVDVFIGGIAEPYLDCGIRMVSFTLGKRSTNKGKQYNCGLIGIRWQSCTMGAYSGNNSR